MTGKRLFWIAGGLGVLALAAALAYVVSGLVAGEKDRAVFSPEWELCRAGDICIAVQAPCGEWQPVNEKHEVDATAYYDHLITVVESTGMICMSVNVSRRKPAAYCLAGACTLAQ